MAVRVRESARPFTKKILSLSGRFPMWEIWSDFVYMAATAISNAVDKSHFEAREASYMKIIEKYNEKERMVFPELMAELAIALEKNPEQDFLGSVYMELELGNHWIGQFFTPYSICQLMADVTCSDAVEQIRKSGFVTMNDCACGAGATLIAGIHGIRRIIEKEGYNWQHHVLVTAQDLDMITGLMCYIQLSLQGAAGYVKIGDSLLDPMSTGDSLENYWFTPMYFSNVWTLRRFFHGPKAEQVNLRNPFHQVP